MYELHPCTLNRQCITSGSSILISPIVIRQSFHEGNLLMLISEHTAARDKDWSCYNE